MDIEYSNKLISLLNSPRFNYYQYYSQSIREQLDQKVKQVNGIVSSKQNSKQCSINENTNTVDQDRNDDTNIKILMNNQNSQSVQNTKIQDDINLIKYLIYEDNNRSKEQNDQSQKQDQSTSNDGIIITNICDKD